MVVSEIVCVCVCVGMGVCMCMYDMVGLGLWWYLSVWLALFPQVHGSQHMFLESGIPFLLVLYSQVSQELPPQNGSGCVQAGFKWVSNPACCR